MFALTASLPNHISQVLSKSEAWKFKTALVETQICWIQLIYTQSTGSSNVLEDSPTMLVLNTDPLSLSLSFALILEPTAALNPWSWSTVFLILCTVEPADGAFLWQAPAFPRVPLRDYTTHNNNAAALFSAQFSITIHNSIAIAPFVTKKIPLTNSPVEPYVLVLTPFKSPVDIGCITALNIKSIELQSRVDGVDGRVVVGGVQLQCPCPRLLSYVASPPYTTPTLANPMDFRQTDSKAK